MLRSFSEFKFFQSFRILVEEADDLRFLVEMEDELGKSYYIDDAKLEDISVTGLGFSSTQRISVGEHVSISLQFKRHHLDLTGSVVRAFNNTLTDESMIYGIELDEDRGLNKFLEHYIQSFSSERLKDSLINSALKERYTKASEGFEMFSLMLSLFKDITYFGDKEGFIENMLEEVVRIMNAQRASIFLINPETNQLEAITALGVGKEAKETFKFDYRLGIAGSVFTTGVALNIDVKNDRTRYNEAFDQKFDFETKSIICHPIHNREDKIIGVIEVINKRNEDRFTVEDEKTMKVLSLIFSSVFHKFNPMSETSQIRRFSTPFDRKYAMIGRTNHITNLRGSILKVKDIDSPVLIQGEHGVGKTLFAKILHFEGRRGLKDFKLIKCEEDTSETQGLLFGPDPKTCALTQCRGGTIVLHQVNALKLEDQKKLMNLIMEGRLPKGNITFDVRIMATSSEDLVMLVEEGRFDKDLYEYLSKALITIEPLRRRQEDIEMLIDYFLKLECKKQGLLLKSFSPKAIEHLNQYDWPGNVSELKRCVERCVLYNPKAHVITDVELDSNVTPLFDLSAKKKAFGETPYVYDYRVNLKDRLALVERDLILSEVKRHSGNKSQAAKSMGISREALRKKLLVSEQILDKLETASSNPLEEAAKETKKQVA